MQGPSLIVRGKGIGHHAVMRVSAAIEALASADELMRGAFFPV